jgi:glycine dehydrogenase subunit 1
MRYSSLSSEDRNAIMQKIGIKSIDEIYLQQNGVLSKSFNLPDHKNEQDTLDYIESFAEQNKVFKHIFAGYGCYNHFIPAAVDAMIQRGEFLTSYTPYQPEVSQGTLQVIFEFQSLICAITNMEVSNASLYDGQTACAEAALMALRVKKNRTKVCVAGEFHPDYAKVLETYLKNIDVEISYQELNNIQINSEYACIITQFPDFAGNVNNLENIREVCNKNDTMMVVVNNEILAFGMIEPPKADIICGDASSLGVPLSFGGPLLGYFTCKKEHVRQMPGRVCGITQDEDGKRSFVLTLSAREQHIRRDKATSNICSNQGLCATAFTVHATLLGEIGFKNLALRNHAIACKLYDNLTKAGFNVKNKTFFNEFVFECKNAKKILETFEKNGILGGVLYKENKILVCTTEMISDESIQKYIEVLKKT